MSKSHAILFLGLYFFFYLIPQYVTDIYYVYDRVTIQLLFLSFLNIIIFSIIIKNGELPSLINAIKKNFHIYSFLILILVATISITKSINVSESIIALSKWVTYFFSFLMIYHIAQKKNINFFKIFLIFSVLGLTLESLRVNYSVFDSVITNGNILQRSMDFRAFTGNPNITSFAIAIKIPAVLYLLFVTNNKTLLGIYTLILSSSILAVMLLLSRAAIIVISIISLFVVFYVLYRRSKDNLVRSLLFLVSIFFSVISYNSLNEKNTAEMIATRFSTATNPEKDQSVNERLNFYRIAIQDIKNNPFFGVGLGNWKLTSIQRANEFLRGYRIPYRTHNDFLEITAEIGLIGSLVFIYFIFYPFLFSVKKIFLEKFDIKYALIFLIVGVYIFDSMLNFPIQRPIMVYYLLFTFTLFHTLKYKQS